MTTQKLKNGMTMTPKRLLIIGNGFDLHLELASSFKDFFENKYSDLEKIVKKEKRIISTTYKLGSIFSISKLPIPNNGDHDMQEIIKDLFYPFNESNNNFWIQYLLIRKFIFEDKVNEWNDIESTIYDFFNNSNNSLLNIIYIILESLCLKNNKSRKTDNQIISEICAKHKLDINKNEFINMLFITQLIVYNMANDKQFPDELKHINEKIVNDKRPINDGVSRLSNAFNSFNVDEKNKIKNILIVYFRKELTKFESSFNEYMNNQIKNFQNYDSLSKNLLLKLSNEEPYNLLNFNYTNPNTSETKCINSNNIHGKLVNPENFNGSKNSLIIGIDGKNISINNSEYQFTKTYRTIVSSSNNENNNVLSPSIKEICFYGHSFAHADFSYFKNIFQYYRIEDLKTKLILFYSEQPNKTETEVIRNQLLAFSKLINEYCEDMKIGSGNSLLRTLQINGKIFIKKI